MSYAILRTNKLKTVNVARSLRHTFREQDTPNADPERRHMNLHFGDFSSKAKNTDQAIEAMHKLLPDKYRKDAVVAIEYLITTSPEWAKSATKKEINAYFIESKNWLDEKHGEENIFVAQVHNDETTPHLVAYVVPNTSDGRLSAKDFLGGPKKLRDMQTEFAERVKSHGLERGIEGSTATHESVSRYYSRVNVQPPKLKIPKLTEDDLKRQGPILKPESSKERLKRINSLIHEQTTTTFRPLLDKANERAEAIRKAEESKQTAKKLEASGNFMREALHGLNKTQQTDVMQQIVSFTDKLRQENLQKQEQEKEQRLDRLTQERQEQREKRQSQNPSQSRGPKM